MTQPTWADEAEIVAIEKEEPPEPPIKLPKGYRHDPPSRWEEVLTVLWVLGMLGVTVGVMVEAAL